MANTAFEYVRQFESWDPLPPSNWLVVRIDGRGFSNFCRKYSFAKPNDRRALDLMNAAAVEVVRSFVDIVLSYGQSDEYSFIFHESTTLFERRSSKLATSIASSFTAEYCLQWPKFFPGDELERPYPTFDARCVCYPKRSVLRDYIKWRQADCHINNLYNTTFWSLVLKGGMDTTAAEERLKGTLSSDKNEILFSNFRINYNDEPEIYKKGTVIYRAYDDDVSSLKMTAKLEHRKQPDLDSKTQLEKEKKRKQKARIAVEHVDIIGNTFWDARPYILAARRGQVYEE